MLVDNFKNCTSQLPVGVLLPSKSKEAVDGYELVREFELGPMTGRIQLAMAVDGVKDNLGKRNTVMLRMMLKSLGPMKGVSDATVRNMTCPDREFLMWVIALSQHDGSAIDIPIKCPFCAFDFEISINPDEMLVHILEEKDRKVVDGRFTFTFDDADHPTLRVRMLDGGDTEKIMPYRDRSDEEAAMRERYAAILTIDGKKLSWDAFIDLTTDEHEWIGECLASLDIGATQMVNARCVECLEEVRTVVPPFSFSSFSQAREVKPPYETRSST